MVVFPHRSVVIRIFTAMSFPRIIGTGTRSRQVAPSRFHDLRHHFIPIASCPGIDYMTIAKWAGHKDGGILIGKVYGHLAETHTKEQAQRGEFLNHRRHHENENIKSDDGQVQRNSRAQSSWPNLIRPDCCTMTLRTS